jgi:protein-S-isoprenylcysteine O-methyltransferase Ste14
MTLGQALALFFTVGWVPLYFCRAEAVGAALEHYESTERRWVQLSVAAVSLYVAASCVSVSVTRDMAPWRALLSMAVFAGGIGFWFWGRVLIGPLRVRRLPEEAPLRLRRDGAFGIVRHPLYFGVLVACAAPLLVAPRPHLLLGFAGCVIVVSVRALQEERRLRAQLGAAYDAYSREVKRLAPFLW